MALSDSPIAFLCRDLSDMKLATNKSSISGALFSDTSMVSALADNDDYRTCTVYFGCFLRKDVPSDLAKAFLNKLRAPMCAVSDYVIDLQLVVFKLMFFMKAFQLRARSGGEFQVKKARSFHIPDNLPAGFTRTTNVTRSAPPSPSSALKSTAFSNGVKNLFQSKHISYLHSCFFGGRGAKTSHPAFDAFSAANKPTFDAITVSNAPRPNNELMKVALALYMTNLKNMWAKNKFFNIALSKLLEILLRVHLAPKRESRYQELKLAKAKKPSKRIAKSSRSLFHNAIRSEKYKLRRYQGKAKGKAEGNSWVRLAQQGQINCIYPDVKRAKKNTGVSGQASGSGFSSMEIALPCGLRIR